MARTGPTGCVGGKRVGRSCHSHLRAAAALRPALGQCRCLPGLSPGPPLAGCRAAGGRALVVDAAPAHRLPAGLYRVRLVLPAHLVGAADRARAARLLGISRVARGGGGYRCLRVGSVLGPLARRCRNRRRCLPVEWDRSRRRCAPELRDRVLVVAVPLLVCRWAVPRGLGSGPRRLAAAPVPRPARRRRRRPHHSLRAPTAGRAGVRWCRSLRYSHDGRANAGERLARLDSAGCPAGPGLAALPLAAIRIVPTLEVAALSPRGQGLEVAAAAVGSAPPWALAAGLALPGLEVLPVLSPTWVAYVGLVPLALAGYAAWCWRETGFPGRTVLLLVFGGVSIVPRLRRLHPALPAAAQGARLCALPRPDALAHPLGVRRRAACCGRLRCVACAWRGSARGVSPRSRLVGAAVTAGGGPDRGRASRRHRRSRART